MFNKSYLCLAIERLINSSDKDRKQDIDTLYKQNMLTKDEYDFLLNKIDKANK